MAQPGQSLINRLQALLAADTTSLAAATALKVHLASAAFTPSLGTTIASLTEATFVGYTAISAVVGNALQWSDPLTGQLVCEMSPPAGGWHWACSGGTGLPQTIYGWWLSDNANAILWGSALLPSQVTITASGQGLDVASVRFGVVPGALV